MIKTWYQLVPLSAVTLLASCAMVEIQSPTAGCSFEAQPVQVTVNFHQRFQPGTFSAVLKQYERGVYNRLLPDVTITQLFSPPPAPGGTSVANRLEFDPKASHYILSVFGDSNPQQAFDSTTDEITFDAPSIQLVPPGTAFNHVSSRCASGPDRLATNLRAGDVITVQVGIPRLLTNNQMTIFLSSSTNNIALQGQVPGAPSTVTWAANTYTSTSFILRAAQDGPFSITARAPGFKPTILSGIVGP